MATNNLTDEDIQAIASSVYELILQGSANSINYGKAEDEMEVPTTEEERKKYNLGVIYVSGETKKAGNMHIQKLFTAFGSDAQTVLNNYVNTTLKGQLDDHTEAKKTQLTQKETSLETALTEHVDDTLKPSLDTYATEKTNAYNQNHTSKMEEWTQKVTQDNSSWDSKVESDKETINELKVAAEEAKNDAEIAAGNAEESKNAAALSATSAGNAKTGADEVLEDMQALKLQMESIASGNSSGLYMTADGKLYQVSIVYKNGFCWKEYSEVVPDDNTEVSAG